VFRPVVILIGLCLWLGQVAVYAQPQGAETPEFQRRFVNRWTFDIEPEIAKKNSKVVSKMVKRAASVLNKSVGLMPYHVRSTLREIPIRVSVGAQNYSPEPSVSTGGGYVHPVLYYVPGEPGFIVLSDPRELLEASDELALGWVTHELAHAFHYLYWGWDSPETIELWEAKTRTYNPPRLTVKGSTKKPSLRQYYANSGPKEFFAEMSTMYFDVNEQMRCSNDNLERIPDSAWLEIHEKAVLEGVKRLWTKKDPR
jgi:hypothetical protein